MWNPVAHSGIFNFWGLVKKGFLSGTGTANPGISYLYDTCSRTVRGPCPRLLSALRLTCVLSSIRSPPYIISRRRFGFRMMMPNHLVSGGYLCAIVHLKLHPYHERQANGKISCQRCLYQVNQTPRVRHVGSGRRLSRHIARFYTQKRWLLNL